jgi:hypothetical protein
MRTSIVILMIMAFAIAGTAMAQNLGSSAERPSKSTPTRIYTSPDEPRQGGDTIFDATVIPGIPFNDSGDTFGFADDYDESCPYTGSTSPDVVYSFTPDNSLAIVIDLCGSSYDTKVYVYDANLNLLACNDDYYFDSYCGVYVSQIEFVEVIAGETYYIVIDGYGGDFGAYELSVLDSWGCYLECHPDAVDEGEPPLHNDYVDTFNGGCNSEEFGTPFQEINWTNDVDGVPPYDGSAWLCGTSGWFTSEGQNSRDTDWFRVYALQTGVMEFTVESEYECYMYKLGPTDCAEVSVELEAVAYCFSPTTLTFPVTAGEEIWLWTGPTTFEGPVTEFTYFATISNNLFDVVPTDEMSFGGVKALYR